MSTLKSGGHRHGLAFPNKGPELTMNTNNLTFSADIRSNTKIKGTMTALKATNNII